MENTLIIDKLININSPAYIGIGSKSAIGKTTLLVTIATDLMKKGKKVLFLTDESVLHVRGKFDGVFKDNTDESMLFVKTFTNVKNDIIPSLTWNHYDVIIIDSCRSSNEDGIICREISNKYGCDIFSSHQLNRDIKGMRYIPKSISVLQITDMFIILNKRILSTTEKIKYFFLFWKIKPNRELDIIKNRYGKQEKIDLYLNFNK